MINWESTRKVFLLGWSQALSDAPGELAQFLWCLSLLGASNPRVQQSVARTGAAAASLQSFSNQKVCYNWFTSI